MPEATTTIHRIHQIDWSTRNRVEILLRDSETALARICDGLTNISPQHDRSAEKAFFMQLMLCMHELLQWLSSQGLRVSFADDVDNADGKTNDITDLISKIRHAVAHSASGNHVLDPVTHIISTYNVCIGKGVMIKTDRFEQGCDYDDEACFFFGGFRLYVKRHIIRAMNEIKAQYQTLLRPSTWRP